MEDSGSIFAAWDLARLEVFPYGKRAVLERDGVTAVWFEPVEFFRRSWGWKRGREALWEEVARFHRTHGGSFRVDVAESETLTEDGWLGSVRVGEPGLEFSYVNEVAMLELAGGGGGGNDVGPLPGLSVSVGVATGADMEEFARIYLECFGARMPLAWEAQRNLMALERVAGWTPWLVWSGGRAVGAYSLFVRGDTGFLSSGATLPAHDGRGIRRHMIRHRVAVARRLGLVRVMSYALRGSSSLRNLLREGFRVVDAKATYRHPGE